MQCFLLRKKRIALNFLTFFCSCVNCFFELLWIRAKIYLKYKLEYTFNSVFHLEKNRSGNRIWGKFAYHFNRSKNNEFKNINWTFTEKVVTPLCLVFFRTKWRPLNDKNGLANFRIITFLNHILFKKFNSTKERVARVGSAVKFTQFNFLSMQRSFSFGAF